jgi:hypothetical protein
MLFCARATGRPPCHRGRTGPFGRAVLPALPPRVVHSLLWPALALLGLALPASADAQQPNVLAPGDSVTVPVTVLPSNRGRGPLRFAVEAAPYVKLDTLRSGPLSGTVASPSPFRLLLRLGVPADQPTGPLHAATVRLTWSDGTQDSVPVLLDVRYTSPPATHVAAASPAGVRPAASDSAALSSHPVLSEGQEWTSVPVGGLTKDVEVELYGTARTVAPGGLLVVRYTVFNWEDTDERVRLRVTLPPGWALLDKEFENREFLVTAEDYELEGEIRVAVPRDARPGERHKVRLVAEVVGEPGGAVVFSRVQVLRRGGLRAGQVGLTGTTSVQASNFAVETFDGARYGGVLDLSGRLTPTTHLALNYRRGPRENNLTNFRIPQEETRWRGTLGLGSVMLQFGNQLTSGGNALSGPYVRGQGLSLHRAEGRVVGDLTMAQPTSLLSGPGGHLVRGSIGVRGKHGRLSLAASDFGRPVGGYSTAPRYPEDIDPDSLERLERERRATEQAPSNRVQGAGVDIELTHARVHRFSARGGWLRLLSAAGDTVREPSAEAQYGFNHRRVSFNARWRQMPASLQGIHLNGNEIAADGSLKLVGDWRISGQAYRTLSEMRGNAFHSEGEGASFGLRYFRKGWRIDLRSNRRSWSYGEQETLARTTNLSFGVPLGSFNFSGFADMGEQRQDTLRRPTQSYRGNLRWNGKAGTASWSTSYFETLSSPPRLRTDLLGSLKLGDWELAGGAWATRGLPRGGEPGFWAQIGIPVTYDLVLSLGIEHAPPGFGKPPHRMGTVGVRHKVALPIPWLRNGEAAP